MLTKAARYLIKIVPESMGSAVTHALAARTRPAPVSPVELEAIKQASKLYYGEGGENIAWSWGTGPLVILVHGWGGRAAQMAPLAVRIAKQGFRAVAIDVTGHGDSPKRHTRWDYFLRDIAALSRTLNEDVHAYVGHSAGALTMMAARKLKGIHAPRYACICAPSHPFPPINVIQKKLNPAKGIMMRYKNHIGGQFETTWDQLQAGSSYASAGSDMLLFYDTTDRFVSDSEGDKIQALCPGASLIKTNAYSHTRILAAPELADAVCGFLTK